MVAATVMTLLQLLGAKPLASTALLPAATTTTAPALTIASMAFWKVVPQLPGPPRLRLSTLAGLVLVGTPDTDNPADQLIASAISEVVPPHFPKARTGRIFEFQLMPATPVLLLLAAPIVPAVCVPCQELSAAMLLPHSLAITQSPGSLGSLSRPPPSFATLVILMKSYPDTVRPTNSVWLVMPVSITATTMLDEPVVIFQAAGMLMPQVS